MKSIKIKFFAAICAIAIAFVGILSIISLTFYDNYYLWQREKALTDVYIQLCSANNKGDEEFINEIIYSEDTEGVRVSVISKNGTVIYDSTMNEQLTGIEKTGETLFYGLKIAQNAVNEADKQKIAATGMDFVNVYDKARAEEFLCLVGILDSTGNYIIARIPFTYLEQNSSFNLLFLGISGGLTLIICIILAFIIARHFTNPLIEIADVANAMAEMDFSKKYEGTVNDEIGRLGQSINRLSEHLEQTIAQLKSTNVKLEHEIKQKEKIDNMRQEFIVNVSHELKTPIALIQGYAEGLQEGIAESDEDRDYYCTTIVDEARRMNKMVMQLLSLSKLELGGENVNVSEIDIDELINTSTNKARVLADAKNQDIQTISSGLIIYSDYGMIEQVVNNYLSNAIRYTPEGGKIIISAYKQLDGVQISVFNEGEGLPENEIPKLWEKFYRTDKARSRELGGTGVGLSIVKATAEVLGGKCDARNVNNGIEFTFFVPDNKPKALPSANVSNDEK